MRSLDETIDGSDGELGSLGDLLADPLSAAGTDRERDVIHLDLPGVDPDAIELTVEQHVLTIKAERHVDHYQADEILVSERPQGTFTRQLMLTESLESDRLEADYDREVITIPFAVQAKPRRVPVTSGGTASRIIEGSTATKS